MIVIVVWPLEQLANVIRDAQIVLHIAVRVVEWRVEREEKERLVWFGLFISSFLLIKKIAVLRFGLIFIN